MVGARSAQRRQRTLDAVKRLLLRESQEQPLLLVFEDLHWIDAETQALLDSLVESLPTARMLLLVNYRPEYAIAGAARPTTPSSASIRCRPRAPRSCWGRCSGTTRALEPLKHVLIARTEGNPFFLEESVRTLVETGRWPASAAPTGWRSRCRRIQVPATVQAVLAARIDRLRAEEKRLLQTAAVIGKDVPFALLQAVAERPRGRRCARGLATPAGSRVPLRDESLSGSGVHLQARADPRSRVRQPAAGRRRALHARIVEAIETLYPDRLAEQSSGWPTTRSGASCGRRPCTTSGRPGEGAGALGLPRSARRSFEQAWRRSGGCPRRARTTEQAMDLRLDLRQRAASARGAPSASFSICDEAEAPGRSARRPGTARAGPAAIMARSLFRIRRP